MSGQTGRIVGAIAGAALAYFTGGASYVALGATLGGAVGSLLDPKQKIEGPRLDDLKVQVSTYGIGIPKLYGTERFGGNVIWSTDKLEVPSTQSQGKGGGGSETTSYKDYVHMRQLLGETPRDGSTVSIVKIFQDGKLMWDASSGIPIGSALASAENLYAGFILYQGHQDQLPNPEEESWTGGPGTASAYRGVVSIYMRAIECPGGRVPQFSFVLSTTAAPATEKLFFGKAAGGTSSRASMINGEITQIESYPSDGSQTVRVTPILRRASTSPPAGLPALLSGSVHWPIIAVSQTTSVRGIHPVSGSPGIGADFAYTIVDFDAGSEAPIVTGLVTDPWVELNPRYAVEDPKGGGWMLKRATNAVVLLPSKTIVALPASEKGAGYHDGFIYCVQFTSSKLQFVTINSAGTVVASVENPTVMGSAPTVRITVAPDGVSFYVVSTTPDNLGKRPIWRVTATEWILLCADTGVLQKSFTYVEAFCTDTYALIGPSSDGVTTGEVSYQMVRFDALSVSDVKAKDIIADQIELSGATSYDVSTLPDSDTVYGYKIAGPASARANIEPILTAFGYYVVDEDGKIKVKRYADITSVATVTFDELGQVEDGSDSTDAMPLNRMQEIDLPRSVTVSYIEPTSDFQTASEQEQRQVTDATEDQQISLAVCFASDKAKKVAQMALYDQCRRQNQRSTTVSRKFAAVSPGDGVTIEYPRGTFKLWLVLSTNDTGAVCEWSVVPGDASIFMQTAIGATGYSSQQVTPLPPSTTLDLFDMPILRDADSDAGKYAALTPLWADDWRGASLRLSADNLNFEEVGSVTLPAVTGFAETVLTDGGGLFGSIDHRGRVIVNVGDGVLNTVTWDDIFSDGSINLAALRCSFTVDGFPDARVEVFQFRVATSLGGGRYELSELVRGLYGTERVSYNHGVGDRFLLLKTSGMLRASLETGAIGSKKFYKAVSIGRSADTVNAIESLTIGYGLKPLSPIDVKLDRTPSNGSILFTWGRRTRFSHNALRSVMPLGETTETYEVVIYTAFDYQVVKNVYRVYTTSLSYFPAVDGYSQLGSIPYRIYQISDAVGRGVPFQPGQGIS